jgi:DtxR family transcriptional regulator, Mn-dependent transcriptional regulator
MSLVPPRGRTQLSFAEEHYLKSVLLLGPEGELVAVKVLAAELEATQASVIEMLKRLQGKGLVEYRPYHGVLLTDSGRLAALKTLRIQRLWEVFLVEKLQLSWDEVHEATEELEHVRSDKVIERLDTYLGHPRFDPHGDPIPDIRGGLRKREDRPLSELHKGQTASVVGVLLHTRDFLQHLDRFGLQIGAELKVVDSYEFDGSMEILINGQKIVLSRAVATHVKVVLTRQHR